VIAVVCAGTSDLPVAEEAASLAGLRRFVPLKVAYGDVSRWHFIL
jgi:NCAIR mutase (PurE)-related protein